MNATNIITAVTGLAIASVTISNGIENLNTNPIVNAGSIDECGFLDGLERKGFTPIKCLSEMTANSYDAESQNVKYVIDSVHFRQIDDGLGMSIVKLVNMFSMFKSNHRERKSMGVSGVGSKPSLLILSKKLGRYSNVIVYSRSFDTNEYVKAIVPWEQIMQSKVYSNKIQITKMNDEEIEAFTTERNTMRHQFGTTIKFEYSNMLLELIKCQFSDSKKKLPLNDRLDFIFGKINMKITFDKQDGILPKVLAKYNYFEGNDLQYYTGVQLDTIAHYIDENHEDRFVWLDPFELDHTFGKEIKKTGRGFDKSPSRVKISGRWTHITNIEIKNGMRKNNRIFNEADPRTPSGASTFLCDYDAPYFITNNRNDDLREVLSKMSINRNSQYINSASLPGFNSATARGGIWSMIKTFHQRTELSYEIFSTQDNNIDKIMGIQENKSQQEPNLPENLIRLITHLKTANVDKIKAHFDEVLSRHNAHRLAIQDAERNREMLAQFIANVNAGEEVDDISNNDVVLPEQPTGVMQQFANANANVGEETITNIHTIINANVIVDNIVVEIHEPPSVPTSQDESEPSVPIVNFKNTLLLKMRECIDKINSYPENQIENNNILVELNNILSKL